MTSTIQSFEQQKQQALSILQQLTSFVQEGRQLGVDIHPDLVAKLEKTVRNTADQKLKVALIGGFSEGKTSIAAAWLEALDRSSMHISQAESSSEVQIYEYKNQLQIIDTPGLFGFKEKLNASSAEIEKYKDITKHYVSEAHLVLYVMNSTNPIKESHSEDLKWLFRTLNLLPRTVFVLSRFDEVADVAEEADFQDKLAIKKDSILKRLNDVLDLRTEEREDISIVAVSANPFDLGVEHWLSNLAQFRALSRIDTLQAATQHTIERNGGMLALANETHKSIITDVITQQLPAAKEAYALLADEARRLTDIKNSQSTELRKAHSNIGQAQLALRRRLLQYFEDLQLQIRNVGMSTFNEFMHREIGSEGCLIQQRLQEIFNEETSSINTDLYRIQLNVNNELTHYDDVLNAMGKKGVKFLSKPGVITNTSVLAARDGLNTATQLVGLDISKYLKFKPWGATKMANGLGSALAVVGLALEAWDSYKEHERQKQFEATIQEMISNFQQQSAEVRQLVDAPDFAERFFPTFNTLKHQLSGIEQEMLSLQKQNERFHKWYDSGVAIDADFRNIHTSRSQAPAQWESVPTIELDTSSTLQALTSTATAAKPAQTSFWSRLFS
ncbi:LeoA/HP0731 family dynamin-like GTPase [Comamonas jiangduensis]|uniref:LeoA/HP0731 family dynamin-like GTPase n=1 Tax=Comamonas jiangduensis TaxID=1194168 RepID=UPI0028AA556A|nr:LeoA/HP0731 family dynamin-like GTPase [Comamonas jiangduensis]